MCDQLELPHILPSCTNIVLHKHTSMLSRFLNTIHTWSRPMCDQLESPYIPHMHQMLGGCHLPRKQVPRISPYIPPPPVYLHLVYEIYVLTTQKWRCCEPQHTHCNKPVLLTYAKMKFTCTQCCMTSAGPM